MAKLDDEIARMKSADPGLPLYHESVEQPVEQVPDRIDYSGVDEAIAAAMRER